MAAQSSGSPTGTLSGLHFGSPNKMCHSDVTSATSRREYYMGEGGGFPRVRAVVSLVCLSARGKSQHPKGSFLELEAGSVLPSLNFPQLDFVKPSSGFHPVTWERVNPHMFKDWCQKIYIWQEPNLCAMSWIHPIQLA
jgi:hypothetical protein